MGRRIDLAVASLLRERVDSTFLDNTIGIDRRTQCDRIRGLMIAVSDTVYLSNMQSGNTIEVANPP